MLAALLGLIGLTLSSVVIMDNDRNDEDDAVDRPLGDSNDLGATSAKSDLYPITDTNANLDDAVDNQMSTVSGASDNVMTSVTQAKMPTSTLLEV